MIGLDKAKDIIGRADWVNFQDGYYEIDAAAVFEDGWMHIGEDHFYNESKRQVAGPNFGRTRILVSLSVSLGVPAIRDISTEWERQAGSEPLSAPDEVADAGLLAPFTEKRYSAGGKCACDS